MKLVFEYNHPMQVRIHSKLLKELHAFQVRKMAGRMGGRVGALGQSTWNSSVWCRGFRRGGDGVHSLLLDLDDALQDWRGQDAIALLAGVGAMVWYFAYQK